MTGKFMLAAGLLVLFAPLWGAPSKGSASEEQSDIVARKIAEKEELAKVRELEEERAEILARIRKKRAELLKSNPKMIKMYLDLLKKARELALELDSDPDIQEMNDARSKVEKKLHQLRQERRQREQQRGEQKNGLVGKDN